MSKNDKVKKMLFVITIWVLCIRKGALKSFNMIEGGGVPKKHGCF